MIFLPIVQRELRVIARRRATHWLRLGTGLGVLIIWIALNLGIQRHSTTSELSQFLFIALGVVALGFAVLAGVFLTADCLSVEKREGTLGLLFLTDLKGYDVILGKLAATSLNGVYGLLTVFPVMALSLLLGGVTFGEVSRQALTLLVALFFSLSVGLFFSVIAREAQHAMIGTLVAMLAVVALVPAFTGLLEELNLVRWEENPVNWLSPVCPFLYAFDGAYRGPDGHVFFWGSLVTQFALGLLLLVGSCARLPRSWQGNEAVPRRWLDKLFRRARSLHPAPKVFRDGLESNPYRWMAARPNRARRVFQWTVSGLFVIWVGIYCSAFFRETAGFGVVVGTMGAFVLHAVVKSLVVLESTRRLSAERSSGILELLLVTPLPAKTIIEGERAASRRAALVPVILASLTNVALILLWLGKISPNAGREPTRIVVATLGGALVVLVLDVWALRWTGMLQALRRRRPHWAVLASMGQILLLPWLALLVFVFFAAAGGIGDKMIEWFIGLWLAGGALIAVISAIWARRRVCSGFRQLVAKGA